MPLLWQPVVQTSLATLAPSSAALYTLLVVSTMRIQRGVLLRFQMYDGQRHIYDYAAANGLLTQFDLILSQDIPPATVLVVSMRETGTSLFGYSGTAVYSAGSGAGVPSTFFTLGASLLCFAFAPTVNGSWTPATGMPMFAIGFNYPPSYPECSHEPPMLGSALATAPNFPDQYAAAGTQPRWVFTYEVVYPVLQYVPEVDACLDVPGIKYEGLVTKYAAGSWTNLRDIITQPWTVIRAPNFLSVSNWEYYTALEEYALPSFLSPDTGPFVAACMPGQLVPVYWKPSYRDPASDEMLPIQSGPLVGAYAQIALLVTSPIPGGTITYFTNDQFDAANGGFGPHQSGIGTATFVDNNWSFAWTTPATRVIPAGTVVFIDNIGNPEALEITIRDAHDSTAVVGAISIPVGGTIQSEAVPSLIALGAWSEWAVGGSRPLVASMFVCAALSEQYAGDFPLLSPALTIHKDRFVEQVVYMQNRIIDNRNLPGTVQCAMINSSNFQRLAWGTEVTPESMPFFRGMDMFSW
jgi:hypothetical protein